MSTNERSGARGRALRRFRVSPINAVFTLLFLAGSVLFFLYDTWLTGTVFLVAAVCQYAFAVFTRRGRSGSDLWRMSVFEPSDERDRAVLRTASAFVAYVAATGSMVAFVAALLFFRSETVLVTYLALQAMAINLLWGVSIWVVARRS
ncbi:hypothetical protein [Brevibacterium jeotgali]|uniref:Uncharacterized protein n=1 Tax=Brevibacterium jeotgali TaxID=1262550 RepID=A0A2H1L643_9MICO|nr:hypothetical protein [Brevibacterium jeotgali]TWB98944.1 hypothetical protein FB108_2843 [Brevibacterium jeotgali]SMY12225.1 hypothetical protein BJEO58_01819 [Brevibacterium jeotgali]